MAEIAIVVYSRYIHRVANNNSDFDVTVVNYVREASNRVRLNDMNPERLNFFLLK